MAGGFAKDGAVQDQIDATVEDAVKRVRDQLPSDGLGSELRRQRHMVEVLEPGVGVNDVRHALAPRAEAERDDRVRFADGGSGDDLLNGPGVAGKLAGCVAQRAREAGRAIGGGRAALISQGDLGPGNIDRRIR